MDFYVLEMENNTSPNATPILLGRPFLITARRKMDVHDWSLTMEFDGEKIRFNIFVLTKQPRRAPLLAEPAVHRPIPACYSAPPRHRDGQPCYQAHALSKCSAFPTNFPRPSANLRSHSVTSVGSVRLSYCVLHVP